MEKTESIIGKTCNAIDRVAVIFGYISALGALFLTGLIFLGVVFRYVFDAPIALRDELAAYVFIGQALLSLGYATVLESHVSTDMFYQHFPKSMQLVVTMFGYGAILICSGLIIWYGSDTAYEYLSKGWRSETSHAFLLWPIVSIIPMSFAVFVLACLSRIRAMIIRVKAGGEVMKAVH